MKREMNTDRIIDKIDEITTEITSNPELQKKLYLVGAILGNGIRSGVGIQNKGGKFKWQDLIGSVLQQYFLKQTGNVGETEPKGEINLSQIT
jgi:hypothetical protein